MNLKLFFTVCTLIFFTVPAILAQSLHHKIADRLMYQSSVSDVVVHFKGHPGFGRSELPVRKENKGLYVYQTLKGHAARTQEKVVDILEASGVHHKQFCVANAVWIKGQIDADVLREIAGYEDVEYISWNEPVKMSRIRQVTPVSKDASIEWGIERINADSVWTMGYTGQGIVVGGQDTGYEWDHPAISQKYRGNHGDSVDHNYNWYDAIHELSPLHDDMITNPSLTPCGIDAPEPCDDHGHGTHTMGTIVGGDENDMLGVAPDASWIGVRCMDRGYGSPMTYLEAFEWFLAPTDVNGNNPDPTLAPHVINNSWRCPEMEGCNPDNFGMLEQAILNLRAAGVVVVVSGGNEGAGGCSSLADPPSIFEGSFAVGATRQNDTIANFSSRGPVMVDSSGRIKPDVSAPGVAVRSAWLDSSYRYLNGTSMAGPHVAGAVALIISANPALSGQVDLIEDILRETARPMKPLYDCATDSLAIPNNSYGYGIIDALAAVERALEITSTAQVSGSSRDLIVFPNPTSGEVNYVLSGEMIQQVEINVFDMTGGLVASFDEKPGIGQIFLDTQASGVYAIVVVDKRSGKIYSDKIFIRP